MTKEEQIAKLAKYINSKEGKERVSELVGKCKGHINNVLSVLIIDKLGIRIAEHIEEVQKSFYTTYMPIVLEAKTYLTDEVRKYIILHR